MKKPFISVISESSKNHHVLWWKAKSHKLAEKLFDNFKRIQNPKTMHVKIAWSSRARALPKGKILVDLQISHPPILKVWKHQNAIIICISYFRIYTELAYAMQKWQKEQEICGQLFDNLKGSDIHDHGKTVHLFNLQSRTYNQITGIDCMQILRHSQHRNLQLSSLKMLFTMNAQQWSIVHFQASYFAVSNEFISFRTSFLIVTFLICLFEHSTSVW